MGLDYVITVQSVNRVRRPHVPDDSTDLLLRKGSKKKWGFSLVINTFTKTKNLYSDEKDLLSIKLNLNLNVNF